MRSASSSTNNLNPSLTPAEVSRDPSADTLFPREFSEAGPEAAPEEAYALSGAESPVTARFASPGPSSYPTPARAPPVITIGVSCPNSSLFLYLGFFVQSYIQDALTADIDFSLTALDALETSIV